MTLRPAVAADASSLAALSIEVWVGTYLRRGINAFFADYALAEFTAARFRAVLADPQEFIVVSENTDGIDGFIRVSTGKTAPVAGCSQTEISTLYVQPRHHGRGLGKALLTVGLRHCRDKADGSVWLTTNSENTPALEFYRAQGFENVGQSYFRIQDQAYLNTVLSYALPCAHPCT